MGIRSDVAIAMKEYVYENLSPEVRKILEEWGFEEVSKYEPQTEKNQDLDDAGRLFATTDVKWYSDYEDITALYKHMREAHDEEDWRILQACHDYPETDDGDDGDWLDNPFDLSKHVSVELQWY